MAGQGEAQESEFLTSARGTQLLLVQRNRLRCVSSFMAKEEKPENSSRYYEMLPTPPTYSPRSGE